MIKCLMHYTYTCFARYITIGSVVLEVVPADEGWELEGGGIVGVVIEGVAGVEEELVAGVVDLAQEEFFRCNSFQINIHIK